MIRRTAVILTGCILLIASSVGLVGAQVRLTPGMHITLGVRIQAARYQLADPGSGAIQISGSDFTVDLRGVEIRGPGTNKGIGIHITGAHNVTVRGGHLSGWLWGIVMERCSGVKLVDCVSSHNGDLPPGTVIDESGHEPEDQHGGGIVLRDSTGSVISRCRAQHQWDGIDLVRSDGNTIEDGDFSYCGNWGVHFWSASKNVFRRNRAIWCTTGEGTLYQSLNGWQTYDAQAVGIDHASCDNLIEENDLRFGGDGVFIRANEGGITPGSPVPPLHSSDRNILRRNDCSFSPNNAIEADFIAGTIIEDNNCSSSHYGMWLGYSRGTVVRRNTCLNDSARAIEIENGQSGLIVDNVFGFDNPRPNTPLVYLRQNGRDKTPSGPYTIRRNLFFGAGECVQLKDTDAGLVANTVLWSGSPPARVVVEESQCHVTETGTRLSPPHESTVTNTPRVTASIHAGALSRVAGLEPSWLPTIVEVNGIPVWVRRTNNGAASFFMPDDFWDRPAVSRADLRVLTSAGWLRPVKVAIVWPNGAPRVESISPNPARIGDNVTIQGSNLRGDVLLNGRVVQAERAPDGRLTFRIPDGILVPTRFNVVVRDPASPDRFSPPVTFAVAVPRESQPHILSATFSPTTLHVGEVLTVTFTVRNNLPVPANVVTKPEPGFTYDEKQAGWEIGVGEPPGTLHLRVTSDHPGPHEPGSWPWFFGFGQPRLAAGATTTVTGRIRVETPGVREFRVGLVASGFRFIDDNAFRTNITVLPR